MSDLKERLRGIYPVGPIADDGTAEFGTRSFSQFISPIQIEAADALDAKDARIEQLEAALRQIARPVFVTEPAGTPESPWQVALRERIELAQEVLGDTQ